MFKRSFIYMLTALMLYSAPTTARELAMVLTPHQSPEAAMAHAKSTLQFLTTLEPGDEAVLMDGYTLKTIGTFTIPTTAAYASAKARLGANKQAVGALLRFAKSARVPTSDNAPTVIGAIRLPQLLRSVAENLFPSEPLDVIVLGSPLYDDPKEAGLSMADGRIPTDKNLTLSRADSPYGAADNPAQLRHVRVHYVHGGMETFRTDQHHFYVQRFWTLYIEAQGGKLVSFHDDLPTVFKRVKRNAPAPTHHYTPDVADKPGMIRLRPHDTGQPISARPVTRESLTLREAVNAPQVEIGITWEAACAACDLDLYAALPGAAVLYFGNADTPEGEHFKDYQDSPENLNGYETIAFKVPVDLSALKLAISFYAGTAPGGVSCEIRITIGGETFAQNFHIPATHGVGDTAAVFDALNTATASAPHILLLDPLKIVGLRE